MVYTYKIDPTSRGLVWEKGPNGMRLSMVGQSGRVDLEEKIQSLQMRFLIQLGEIPLYPNTGFDYEGLIGEYNDNEELTTDDEARLRAAVILTVQQDPDVVSPLLYLDVKEEPDTRTWLVRFGVKITTGEIAQIEQRIGVVETESGIGAI
jgi:hypothetical protein